MTVMIGAFACRVYRREARRLLGLGAKEAGVRGTYREGWTRHMYRVEVSPESERRMMALSELADDTGYLPALVTYYIAEGSVLFEVAGEDPGPLALFIAEVGYAPARFVCIVTVKPRNPGAPGLPGLCLGLGRPEGP